MKKSAVAVSEIILPLCLLAGQTALMAQPVISSGGVVNAASGMPPALAGGGIAVGSYFTIYGHGLGPQTAAQAASYPFQTALSTVSVTVSKGSSSVNAYPFYAQDGQINAILPSNAPLGPSSVVVTYNGQSSAPQTINVVDASVGIFTVNSTSYGPAIFQNVNASGDRPLNSSTATAQPGQIGVLWATGLGAINAPDNIAPPVASLNTPIEIFVGGVPVTNIQYSGRAPGDAGVDYLQFVIPANAPQGCFVPIQVRVKGTVASNIATVAIDPNGKACSDPNNALTQNFTAGGRIGEVALMRFALGTQSSTTDTTVDVGAAFFQKLTGGPFAFSPLAANPPVGSCTAYARGVDVASLSSSTVTGIAALDGIVPAILSGAGTALDAGPALTLAAAAGTRNIPKSGGAYEAILGSNPAVAGVTSNGLVLDPGTVTVAGTGGADVGSFTATLSPPAAIAWTNRGQIAGVDQTQGVTVSWSGAAPSSQVVAIAGVSTDKTAGLTGMFLCTAPAGTGSFTVPEQIVANLPSTRPGGTDTAGVLMVGEATSVAPVKFVAQSLDAGYGVFNYFSAKTVDYTQGALPSSAPAISLTSSSVDFSTVIVGQPKNLTVNVGNSGNAPLTVNSLSLSNPLFTVPGLTAPFTVAPGAQQVLTIQFAPTAAGSQIATLTIASNDPVKPSVTISLTGTGVTNPNSPTPIITIVTPPAVTAGGPSFTLTVTGTGFVQQSVVQWNGVNKPTTYDSSTQLHATISASDIATVTVGRVAVVNPPPGGGTSNSLTVSVNATGSGLTITQFDFSSCPMINAYLTIADRNGNGVPGLSNISVKCTEDGAPVFCDVSSASASGIPLDLALIIDTSANTVNGGIAIERTVADELVSQLGPDTSIELIQAGTTAAVAQNFTPDKPTVTALINTLPTGTAGAALYDAVDTAIKAVQSQRGTHRNAVVIVTQDDNGAGAIQNSSTVLNEAIGASVPIYSITISPGSTIPSLVTFLNQLALNSFGTFYPDTPGVSPQFTMDQIASILNSTYLVSYTTQTPNVPHTLGINNGYSAGTGVTSRSFQGCAAH